MYEAGIEVTDADFEFVRPPLSKNFVLKVFEKYQLDFIVYFGENMIYITGQNSEPLVPLYPGAGYPGDLELILDFMARERIHRLRYEKGVLFRSAISELSDSKVQLANSKEYKE